MTFEDAYFKQKILKQDSLEAFGFTTTEQGYEFRKTLIADELEARLLIDLEGKLTGQVVDIDLDEPYDIFRSPQATGTYVGQVREACQESLARIRQACFEVEDFLYPQTKRLMAYISLHYQGTIEYLWERSPESGAIRHRDTLKWYGVFMTINWNKLDAGKSGKIEVLNVKSDQVAQFVQQKGIYPAFHMNKKYWLSIPLDGTIADEELFALVDSSWQLTKKGK